MIDKTTLGVTAEPEEVEAVLHNLCGYHLAEPDPLFRYNVLTREQVLYDALVAAIKRERGRALADLVARGQTLTQIAASTNLATRQRVQRLIAVARAAEEAAAEVQAASRQFEERLAAVEATLDEVVSGIAAPVAEYPSEAYPSEEHLGDSLDDEGTGILEPTQAMPTLRPLLHPTKEMPPTEENAPWWRRGRDTTGVA